MVWDKKTRRNSDKIVPKRETTATQTQNRNPAAPTNSNTTATSDSNTAEEAATTQNREKTTRTETEARQRKRREEERRGEEWRGEERSGEEDERGERKGTDDENQVFKTQKKRRGIGEKCLLHIENAKHTTFPRKNGLIVKRTFPFFWRDILSKKRPFRVRKSAEHELCNTKKTAARVMSDCVIFAHSIFR